MAAKIENPRNTKMPGRPRFVLRDSSGLINSSVEGDGNTLTFTEGTRFAVVGWIESMVSDDRKRQILFDLWRVRQTLKETPDQAMTHLETSFVNLSKMWSET
jgi:predicted 2-oxoglutarate/Fe(II)-dependent dioxygenase YbiX